MQAAFFVSEFEFFFNLQMFSVNFRKVNVLKNILDKFFQIMCLAKSLLAEMYGVCLCLSIEATVQKLQKSLYATWGGGSNIWGIKLLFTAKMSDV